MVGFGFSIKVNLFVKFIEIGAVIVMLKLKSPLSDPRLRCGTNLKCFEISNRSNSLTPLHREVGFSMY